MLALAETDGSRSRIRAWCVSVCGSLVADHLKSTKDCRKTNFNFFEMICVLKNVLTSLNKWKARDNRDACGF